MIIAAGLIAQGCGSPSNLNKNGSSTNGSNVALASPKPTPACDDAIITSELTKIYANPPFAADEKNFNFFSKGCEVTLYGGVSSASIRQQAIIAAEKTEGVIDVHDSKFYPNTTTTSRPIPGTCACPTDYKACGDICIPVGDQCNIKGEPCQTIAGTPVPVKTP